MHGAEQAGFIVASLALGVLTIGSIAAWAFLDRRARAGREPGTKAVPRSIASRIAAFCAGFFGCCILFVAVWFFLGMIIVGPVLTSDGNAHRAFDRAYLAVLGLGGCLAAAALVFHRRLGFPLEFAAGGLAGTIVVAWLNII